MKIMFLNCWYAKAGKDFFDYINLESKSVDIFCLSEVQPDLFQLLQNKLHDFNSFYDKSIYDDVMKFFYGQAVFIKKTIKVEYANRVELFRNVHNDQGFAQNFKLTINNKKFHLTNIHGKARPGHKLDTLARINQTKKILNYYKNYTDPIVIGGDFNLLPTTKSVRMFEKEGYRNLIKEFNIKDTRGDINHKNFAKDDRQYFADYCFVKGGVKVKSFEVPNVLVSDHLPLILEFEI